MSRSLSDAGWLNEPELQKLLSILNANGEEARVNGGAVRNSLLDEPVSDIDLSTTLEPQAVIKRLTSAEIKVVPTGIEHGTVTAVIDGKSFEITTLRSDIETNGRHAVVRFGRDWCEDARRRDFTINALYADADGRVFDPLGGLSDLEKKVVRFIGEPEDRINEDHLRILRFFRFFAWYGHGAPDREGLKACVRLKQSLDLLSAERVWKELRKMLTAPDPARAILWMRQAGVLSVVLPESEKWGIDGVPRLLQAENQLGWGVDPLLRLMAMIPQRSGSVEALGVRLKLSNKECKRLENWATSTAPMPNLGLAEFGKILYRGLQQGIIDATRIELARLREAGAHDDGALKDAARMDQLLTYAGNWQKPEFPVKGRDLIEKGVKPGIKLGKTLEEMENRWIESEFKLGKPELLGR